MSESDAYFRVNEQDIIASYEFDYDAIVDFDTRLECSKATANCFFFPPGGILACSLLALCGRANIDDKARAQHLAISRDGIRYIVEKHDGACRMSMCQQGKVSKTVPYDKITDCDVEDPAGAEGCCPPVNRTLYTVRVDTAGSDQMSLMIKGLKDPQTFKRDVWSIKRGEAVGGVVVAQPAQAASASAPASENSRGIEAVMQRQTILLEGIFEQLKMQNARGHKSTADEETDADGQKEDEVKKPCVSDEKQTQTQTIFTF